MHLLLSRAQNLPAPPLAVTYWQLRDGALMRDLLLAVRADEAWCALFTRAHMHAHNMHTHAHACTHTCADACACVHRRSHSHVNHTLASLGEGAKNPFRKGHTELPSDFVQPPAGIDMRTGAPLA